MLKPPREETGFGKVAESDQQEQWERRSKTWVFEGGEKHITHGYPSFCVVLVGAPGHAPQEFPSIHCAPSPLSFLWELCTIPERILPSSLGKPPNAAPVPLRRNPQHF